MQRTLWLIAVIFAALAVGLQATDPPEKVEVLLSQGKLEGVRETIGESRFFYSFRGIPYAAPPVGDLRFKDPSQPLPWSGVRKGMTASACPQLDVLAIFDQGRIKVMGQEDCLYLHVYTPKPTESKLPVMVYIHGGGFQFGEADSFGGSPRPLLREDIVLVSIQYRLGALGFLSTGDSVLPGNLGLKDQTFALQWVHDNIHKFGGDNSKVTVFGESAGAASTHFQVLTPYAEGLLQRAILHSSTAITPLALRDDHAERAIKIAKHFNCPEAENPSVDSATLLQCFKARSVLELITAATLDTVGILPFYLGPRVDGDFVPAHPAQLLMEGRYNRVDLISGLCRDEGTAFLIRFVENDSMMANFVNEFDHKGPILTALENEDNSLYLTKRGFYHYVGGLDITEDNMEAVQMLVSDSMFNVGHDEVTMLHGRDAAFGRNTYRYELQHRPEPSFMELFNTDKDFTKHWIPHGEDLRFIFSEAFGIAPINRTEDVFLSDIMVTLWTNFARTGNPTPELNLGFKWEPMKSTDDLRYLSLTPNPRMEDDNRTKNREFWRNLPLKVNKVLFPERFTCSQDNIC